MKFTFIEWAIIAAILGILTAFALSAPARHKEAEDFMVDCLQHEPRYSCESKWKQMHPDPVVVFAPFNR